MASLLTFQICSETTTDHRCEGGLGQSVRRDTCRPRASVSEGASWNVAR